MANNRTSHDYANDLRSLADYLDGKPAFNLPQYFTPFFYATFDSKDDFIEAVRALKPGRKEIREDTYPGSGSAVYFHPKWEMEDKITIRLEVPRDKVCRKVKEAVWECEPLLSQEELEEVGEVE